MCAKMFDVLKFCVLLFFFLLIVQSSSSLELCSNKKSENKCLCKRFTDSSSGLPNTEADCTALSFTDFPDLTQLRNDVSILDLSVNNIKILDPTTDTKVSSKNLRKLIVAYNKIEYVDVEFFDELPELEVLDLSYNNITSFEEGDIFSPLKKLVYLDLRFNNIKLLPDGIFEPLTHLKYLDLSYNSVGNYLMQSKEVLTRSLGVSPNITHLALDNVGLSYLHNSYFDSYNLKYVTLADNKFNTIPTLPYSVEYLDLSGNNLTYISAKYLNYHSLKTLKLNRMPSLTSIHHYAFYNLQSLEKLVITDCPNLSEFTELAFGIASKTIDLHPKYLSLARNGLQSLNETYKYLFRKMTHIDIRHNPWNCDCGILWLQEFEHELLKSYDIRCNTPRRLKNKSVMELTDEDLQHCYPEIYGKTSHRVMIVVLMAAVIVLIGVIFYLVRYPNTWLNPKHIGIGPNSPYNAAPTSEA